MATNQISNQSSISNYQSKNLKQSDKNPISDRKGAGKIEKKLDSGKKDTEPVVNKIKDKKSEEIEQYLKLVSRFESALKNDEIEDDELEKIFNNLTERIKSLNIINKKRLMESQFFKKQKITNLTEMKDSLTELFKDNIKRQEGLDFLRSPEFITLLHNEAETPKTYSPSTVLANSKEAANREPGNNHKPEDRNDSRGKEPNITT